MKFDEDDPQFRITLSQQMASACTGALITSLFMTPLDVVKIRLQAQQKALLSNKCYLYCNGLMEHLCPCGQGNMERRAHFTGTVDAFYKIAKIEGIPALWSGLSPTLVLAVPCTVIYFVTYENLRYEMKKAYNALYLTGYCDESQGHKFNQETPSKHQLTSVTVATQPIWIPLIAGASARMTAVTIVSPLELIRTKMQSKKLSYAEIQTALGYVVKAEGARGLFRGLGSTLLRDVPFSGIYWTTFESTKRYFGKPDSEKNTFLFNFWCGSIAGSIAAFITLPFDVVKTHQQIELGEKEIYSDPKRKQKASSMKEIVKSIYANNGVRGLFTGLFPRICKVAPACAIMIATFEYGKQFFRDYNIRNFKESMQRPQEIVFVTKSSTSENKGFS